MDAGHDAYHVRITRHAATPAAMAEAQLALLQRRSVDARAVAVRTWKRRGVVVLGIVVAAGLLLLLMAVPSAGRATAYENCVADAEATAARFSAVQAGGGASGQAASVDELCAGYRD